MVDSEADSNKKSINKLAPRWSAPVQIYACFLNSFSLCDMDSKPLKNLQFIHSQRLHHFIALRGSTLDQKYRDAGEYIPSEEDLSIAEAEERMAEALYTVTAAEDTLQTSWPLEFHRASRTATRAVPERGGPIEWRSRGVLDAGVAV